MDGKRTLNGSVMNPSQSPGSHSCVFVQRVYILVVATRKQNRTDEQLTGVLGLMVLENRHGAVCDQRYIIGRLPGASLLPRGRRRPEV